MGEVPLYVSLRFQLLRETPGHERVEGEELARLAKTLDVNGLQYS